MVRKIMRDEAFLSQRAEPASLGDLEVARDLLDTLAAHRDGCGGENYFYPHYLRSAKAGCGRFYPVWH